jgi:hypothetical protein
MAGTIVADNIQAASTSTLVLKNGVANTPPTVQDSGGTEIGTFCRAWVNFNGTSTVAIRASFNVSSITDNGTGDYTVNFTTALADANYSTSVTSATNSGSYSTAGSLRIDVGAPTTTACRVVSLQTNTTAFTDSAYVNVAIFR